MSFRARPGWGKLSGMTLRCDLVIRHATILDGTGAPRFETTPNGNAVNLEDEMLKVAQNQSDYQLAASLYSKGLGLMKIAIGKGR